MKKSTIALLGISLVFAGCSKENVINPASSTGITGIEITEVDGYADFIELYNSGSETVSLEGCKLRRLRVKDGLEDKQTIWLGTSSVSLAPGEYLVLNYEEGKTDNNLYPLNLQNKISAKKNINLWFQNSVNTVLSTFQRGSKGIGWGLVNMPACKDDADVEYSFSLVSGEWVLATSTPGADNASKAADIPTQMMTVVLNEISLPDNAVELYNFGAESVNIGGFELRWGRIKSGVADNQTVYTIPTGTTIAAGAYLKLTPGINIGLYNACNIRIYLRDPSTLDGFDQKIVWDDFRRGKKGDGWTSTTLSATTLPYARIPDGTGDWYLENAATIGAANGTSAGEIPEL